MPATRVEIADSIGEAFAAGPMTREDLLAAANRAGARPQVLRVLERLPHGPFHELRQLWGSIPDVPIELDPGRPVSGTSS